MCPPSPPASTGDELEADLAMSVNAAGPVPTTCIIEPAPSSVVNNPAYEMICFASTGTAKRKTKHKKHDSRHEVGTGII